METVFTRGSPRDQLALLDALFDQAPVGLAFWDTDLRYRRINPELAAMHGIGSEEHLGLTVPEALGPLGERIERRLREVLETGRPAIEIAFSGEVPDRPGELRHWRSSYYPVADADGRRRGIGGVVVEVTEQVAARADAEAATALLDAVFAVSPVAMAFWDSELRYVRINDAGAALNGLPVEAHLGHRVEDVLKGPFGERVVALLRRVLESGEPVVTELAGERPGRPGEQHRRHGTYYPLPGPTGEVAGVGAVVQDITERHAADELRRRLLAQETAARQRAELLAAVGATLASSLDYDETLDAVTRALVPAVADECTVTLVGPRGELVRAAATPPEAPSGRGAEVAEVIASGRPLAGFDAPGSFVCAPLTAHGAVQGALTLVARAGGRRYAEADLLFVQALADRAALAIENARLHTERAHIARTLQRSLLPPALPDVPGMEAAARYLPAGGRPGEVGGDFYDLFESEPGIYTVIVGDVAGKGADAAALTALARYTLRTASMLDTSPERNLGLLNDALLARDAGTCTVVYGRLCPSDGQAVLRAAAAGHPSPLVLRAGGGVEELTGNGTLLGAIDHPRQQASERTLRSGDAVLFYTDGATDVRAPDGVLGDALLRRELARCSGCSADDVVERVARAVTEAQGGRLDDDLALLALRVR